MNSSPHFANSSAGLKRRIDLADEALAAKVRWSLEATGRHQLSQIQVAVQSGDVRLSGPVASYYLKQIAQHAVMSVEGVGRVDSCLSVEPIAPREQNSSS